jgi:diguanylate cyclase (GGDEF)-like protein/PAS domain S-box-containing protein
VKISVAEWKNLFDTTSDAVCFLDKDGKIKDCNKAMEKIVGLSKDQIRGQKSCKFFHGQGKNIRGCPLEKTLKSKHKEKIIVQEGDKQLEIRVIPELDDNGKLIGAIHITRNITEKEDAEKVFTERVTLSSLAAEMGFAMTSINTLENILQRCTEILVEFLEVAFARIWVFNPEKQELELKASAGMYTHLNGPHERIPLDAPSKIALIAKSQTPHLTNEIIGDSYVTDQDWAKKEGMVAFAGYPLTVEKELIGVIGMFSRHPLSEFTLKYVKGIADGVSTTIRRKQLEDEIYKNSFYDALTKLPNRTLFLDRLGMAFKRSKRTRKFNYAVMTLDIDRFKNINDALGHLIGDKLIKEVGHRLVDLLRAVDTVARMGSNEYIILLEGIAGNNIVKNMAERIQRAIRRPFKIEGHQLKVTASIGIVIGSEKYTDPTMVLRNAEVALHVAKFLGKDQYIIFNEDMHKKSLAYFEMEGDLHMALERNEFRVYYQPIFSIKRNALKGFESLIRWQHPTQGLILPGKFIPVADETLLIIPIGDFVLDTSCRQMKKWTEQYKTKSPLIINVNLSANQFIQPDLANQIKNVLKKTGLNTSQLHLEITESVAMKNIQYTIGILQKLKNLGVQLSIDDFGTGYSSLSYLQRFAMHSLKIDRSFIKDIDKNTENKAIVTAIIKMAHTLGIDVVAEGIETEEQLTILKKIGCDYGQGYLFAKPMDVERAGEFIRESMSPGKKPGPRH